MSPRAWKVLPAIALIWSCTAEAQEKPEWQRRLDALKLPADPKFDAALGRASDKENKCFDRAALKAMSAGRPNKEIGEIACKACDAVISEYASIYLQANQHRYIGMTIEQAVSGQRDHCLMFTSLRVSDLRYDYDHAVVERAAYGVFDKWRIEERVARNGLLSYVLLTQAETGPLAIEMTCYPVDKRIVENLLGPFTKSGAEVYVTYSRDSGVMKQALGKPDDGMVRISGADGHDSLMSMTQWAEKSLRISVQGQAAVFSMAGYRAGFLDWTAKCLK